MWPSANALTLSETQRKALTALVQGRNTPQKMALRARVALLGAEGRSNYAISQELGVNRKTVILWRNRFLQGGVEALGDRSRPGRRPALTQEVVDTVIHVTLHQQPRGATHWSTRTLARHVGLSKMAVQRIWKTQGLQPHRTARFKLSRDPKFVEKLRDVVGLYLNPPEHALVLSVDEKSQIQALQRTQPGLPMKKGRAGTMTHDYKRHGTTTLFAALNVLEGKVIGDCYPRHRHQEFLHFLGKIDRDLPPDLDLHVILDNSSTHQHARVKRWLGRHRRFHFHFIPTSSSWLNLVERWFREITQKAIRRGSFHSVSELVAAILEFLEVSNENPRRFVWTKTADQILAKIHRAAKIHAIVQNR